MIDARPAAQPASASRIRDAGGRDASTVLAAVGSSESGLTEAEAARRLVQAGPNAVRRHRARPGRVLLRQIRSPILILLFATAVVSSFVGEAVEATIIAVILLVSVGLGFVNEFRAERAADALHDRLRHTVVALRGGARRRVDVTDLVPGDVVVLSVGTVVPADLRLLQVSGLACDESIVTGEATPAQKTTAPVHDAGIGDLGCCALMGTIVHAGEGLGVVVATAGDTEFGSIAAGLAGAEPQTEFQRGLGRFSVFLLIVALILTSVIFAAALVLGRPLIESLLFSLAIAVGITPQLLPAVVSTSLAAGSRALARRRVLVKRMVCIEDLGDLDLLVTDKTGTLTTGRIAFDRAVPIGTTTADEVLLLGLLATDSDAAIGEVGQNQLDEALREAPGASAAPVAAYRRLAVMPFDHERRRCTALTRAAGSEPIVVVKGAPESVLPLCVGTATGEAPAALEGLYREGARVVAVASRTAHGTTSLDDGSEHGLVLRGFLAFSDAVKPDAGASLDRLADLGVEVKIATGDGAVVAERLWAQLGRTSGRTLDGRAVDALTDDELTEAARSASIFARVSPEQKGRIVRVLRRKGARGRLPGRRRQ